MAARYEMIAVAVVTKPTIDSQFAMLDDLVGDDSPSSPSRR